MAARRKAFRMDHPIIITFLVIAVVSSMSLAAEVLKPLALAVLLSFALAPFVRFLEARRVPRAAAVCSVIVLMLGLLVAFGYVVGNQLTGLARDIPKSQANIERKLHAVLPKGEGPWARALGVFQDIEKEVGEGAKVTGTQKDPEGSTDVKTKPVTDDVQKVSVVSIPTFRERLSGAVGPYLEFLSVGFLVLILSLFMLMNREDLGDRITRLFGRGRITLTTRTMDEVGARISRYLGTFVAVNTTFGIIIGTGLAIIGVPYAILWGFIAGVLRFVPYVGAAVAFGLPLIYSVAHFTGWYQPIAVVVLFLVIETIANSFLEPVIYGKTTGVSALGLLVAAMFWTWLWGMVGLLVSTPLTVCLAVLGKYVPSLGVFATLLGEEVDLGNEVRLYQRLLALDQDGATEIVDEALKTKPQAEVFDSLLIPALSQTERDRARDEVDDVEREFVWRVIGDVMDDLGDTAGIDLKSIAAGASADGGASKMKVVGVAVSDRGDALALRMVGHLLKGTVGEFEIISGEDSPLKLAAAVTQSAPNLVILSHLPPVGLTAARYLVHRLRAQMPSLPIVVGRWGDHGDVDAITKNLVSSGATKVAFGIADARDRVLEVLAPSKDGKLKGLAAVSGKA